jgi:hypothetical protein
MRRRWRRPDAVVMESLPTPPWRESVVEPVAIDGLPAPEQHADNQFSTSPVEIPPGVSPRFR